jgi:hypothetical protein
MIEIKEANLYFRKLFGDKKPTPGTYSIPTETPRGSGFMKVVFNSDNTMSSFEIFKDEGLTISREEWKKESEKMRKKLKLTFEAEYEITARDERAMNDAELQLSEFDMSAVSSYGTDSSIIRLTSSKMINSIE